MERKVFDFATLRLLCVWGVRTTSSLLSDDGTGSMNAFSQAAEVTWGFWANQPTLASALDD